MNIRVDLNTTIADGSEVVFRSPADCSQVTGLAIYHHGGKTEFSFADAHGNNVGDIDHLFAENAVVKVILDVTAGMAFVQNADTNAYIERTFVKTINGKAPDEKGNVEVKTPEGGNGTPGQDGADGGFYVPEVAQVSETEVEISFTSQGGENMPKVEPVKLTLPRGADGKKGDTGATGPQGEPGAKGEQGVPGEKGEKGDPGIPGNNGAPGKDGAPGADGENGYTPVKGVDYYTPADKAEFEAFLASELAKRGQLKPEFANSVEECTDTSKLYVLPDGFIYACLLTKGFAGTNLADPDSADWKADTRLSTSSTSAMEGIYTTNYIPCKMGDIIRVRGLDITDTVNNAGARCHILNSSKALAVADCGYIHTLIQNEYGSVNGDIITITAGYTGNSPSVAVSATAYMRFCGKLMDGYAPDDVIITVNEEISDDAETYAWKSTGHAFVPADYEQNIIALEATIAKHEAQLKVLESGEHDSGVPAYWIDELATKADAIQTAMESAGRNKSAFLWYTDAHWTSNSKMSPALLKYLVDKTPINKVNFGGDIIGDPVSHTHENIKYVYEWRKLIADLPNHHSVYGNHDVYHRSADVSKMAYAYMIAPEETADMVVGGDSCYYIDNPSEKTRYLYLSYLTENTAEMTAQGSFIMDALSSVKEGWHIVVISHRWWQYTSVSDPTTGSVPAYEVEILSILDAYNARGTRAGSAYFASADFSNGKGKVEFCIGGHIHVDYDFSSDGGIPVIITASDTNQERSPDDTEDSGAVGTITESAVFGIIADYDSGKITVVGVGRGTSREISL